MSEPLTADDWVAELDARMDADPNVELAPVTVGIMRTTQIIHEAMRAEYLRGIKDAARALEAKRNGAHDHEPPGQCSLCSDVATIRDLASDGAP